MLAVAACAMHGATARAAEAQLQHYKPEAQARVPNLHGDTDRPLRYRPDGDDFVIDDGIEFFNRPLYGGNSAFRVDGGDKPEFSLYLPGRGGNLRLGVCMPAAGAHCLWLHDAASITTRYRPGELHYEIRDAQLGAGGRITVMALAYAATEGLGVQVQGTGLPASAQLVIAFGAGDGKRGRRDGDIGTEAVPISEYFQLAPGAARGARIAAQADGFRVVAPHATIAVTTATAAGNGTDHANGVTSARADAGHGAASTDSTSPTILHRPGTGSAVAPMAAARTPLLVTRHDANLWPRLDALLAAVSRDGGNADATATATATADTGANANANADANANAATGVAVARLPLGAAPVQIAVQVTARAGAQEQEAYRAVGATTDGDRAAGRLLPAFGTTELATRFDQARRHFDHLRHRVRIDTPDPYLNAAMGALNVAADAVWDDGQGAIMHGAVAWRTKLLGWRGPYALDALGWHDRARANIDAWTGRQNTSPVPAQIPAPEAATNLARNEAALHSNGDLSTSHYDMNLVFIDALLRHLLWTGDKALAQAVWPVLERHLAWERRLFRRPFGTDQLPLYDAYAAIWASDDLYYNGGGATHTSAYNAWHNAMAARIATWLGKDATPYTTEAAAIRQAMRTQLWMPQQGAFAEYRDALGGQLLHPHYALWSFYHTVDAQVPTPFEAARMAAALDRDRRAIPVRGPGVPSDRPYRVLPSTDWMPYSWSINNVVMGENLHTALAYWQAGRSETAFELTKGALLASLYMGISPGNIGTMNYLDVYRREAQRDFADGAGVMARTLVEGLFGVQPDALAGVLTVRPGLPRAWDHASLAHPDVNVAYRRTGQRERWTVGQAGRRFAQLTLELPARAANVVSVRVNGKPARWRNVDDAVGAPRLRLDTPLGASAAIEIVWDGVAIDARVAKLDAGAGAQQGFVRYRQGAFAWWQQAPAAAASTASAPAQTVTSSAAAAGAAAQCVASGPQWLHGAPVQARTVDLTPWFNDEVTQLFKPGKYVTPRSPYATLALPAQGAGAWAGHVQELPEIDDAGLRALGGTLTLPNGLHFATPPAGANILFTSQWDNYPREVTVPLQGQARRAFLLMAGSTNHMQSRIDNGETEVTYVDGTSTRVALRNPDNWWPIEQDYLIDDYQFPFCGQLPLRVDLKTARAQVPATGKHPANGRRIAGGAATVIELPLDPARQLQSITVRALANDVVLGVMGVTLDSAP